MSWNNKSDLSAFWELEERLKDLEGKRQQVTDNMKRILSAADSEKRGLTDSENVRYERLDNRFDRLCDDIKELEDLFLC